MFSPLVNEILTALNVVLNCAYCGFIIVSIVILEFRRRGWRPPTWVSVIWRLTKWPALAGIVGLGALHYLATANPKALPVLILTSAVGVRTWWMVRNVGDDDDSMKKLRDRLKAKVEQFGSKLIVVPEPA